MDNDKIIGSSGNSNGLGGTPGYQLPKTWQEKFDEAFGIYWGNYKNTLYRCNPNDILDRPSVINNKAVKQFITYLRKHDEEELIKIVDKLKLDVETRIAFKNLKPESVGYNKCALKVQIKIKQIKQLIKDYYQNN